MRLSLAEPTPLPRNTTANVKDSVCILRTYILPVSFLAYVDSVRPTCEAGRGRLDFWISVPPPLLWALARWRPEAA